MVWRKKIAKNLRKICEIFAKYSRKICENSWKICKKFAKKLRKIKIHAKFAKNLWNIREFWFFANFLQIFHKFFTNISQIFRKFFANFLCQTTWRVCNRVTFEINAIRVTSSVQALSVLAHTCLLTQLRYSSRIQQNSEL